MLYVSEASESIGPNLKLWRYLDFTKFVSMLDKKSLYFSRLDTLNDPFEGSHTRNHIDTRIGKFTDELIEFCRKKDPTVDKEKLSRINSSTNKVQRELIYVNCWHNNEYESSAMWKSYLKGDEGVAIESSVNRLLLSLKQTKDVIFMGKVKYIDYEKESITDEDHTIPFLYKRKSFQHENEVRLNLRLPFHEIINGVLTIYPDMEIPDIMKAEDIMWTKERIGALGVYIPINLDALIEKVYVSPTADDWFYDLVESVSENYCLKKEVVQSALADRSPLF
jgi:hypothetical protein